MKPATTYHFQNCKRIFPKKGWGKHNLSYTHSLMGSTMAIVDFYFNKYLKCVSNRNAFYSLIVPLFCLALIYQHSFQGWNPWSVCVCVCACACVCVCVRASVLKFWLFSTFDFSKERLFLFQQLFYFFHLMSTLQRARDFVFCQTQAYWFLWRNIMAAVNHLWPERIAFPREWKKTEPRSPYVFCIRITEWTPPLGK